MPSWRVLLLAVCASARVVDRVRTLDARDGGPWFPSVRPASRAGYRGIEFSHLLKTGGRTTARVIGEALRRCSGEDLDSIGVAEAGPRRPCVVNRWAPHPYFRQKHTWDIRGSDPALDYFRIHLMREPCAYYLSLWRYQGSLEGQLTHKILDRCYDARTAAALEAPAGAPSERFFPQSVVAAALDVSPAQIEEWALQFTRDPSVSPWREKGVCGKHSHHTHHLSQLLCQKANATMLGLVHAMKSSFSAFVRELHRGSSLGTLAFRVWCTQRRRYPNSTPGWDDGQLSECAKDVPAGTARAIMAELNAPWEGLFADIDCFVGTATLERDLESCLLRFDRQNPGVVRHWRLRKAIERHDVIGRSAKAGAGRHIPCDDFYASDANKYEFAIGTEEKSLALRVFAALTGAMTTGGGSVRGLVEALDAPLFHAFDYRCCQVRGPLTPPVW